MWLLSLPEAQRAPPKDCKLHDVQLVMQVPTVQVQDPCFGQLCGTTEPQESQINGPTKCCPETLDNDAASEAKENKKLTDI